MTIALAPTLEIYGKIDGTDSRFRHATLGLLFLTTIIIVNKLISQADRTGFSDVMSDRMYPPLPYPQWKLEKRQKYFSILFLLTDQSRNTVRIF